MAGNIEEVGARFVLTNGARFKTQMDAARASLAAFNDEQVRSAELAKANADALKVEGDAAKASAAATSTAADATAVSSAKASSALKDQAVAQDEVAASAKRTAATVDTAAAATTGSWKKAGEMSSKILKFASIGIAATVYEGVKNWMSFQQMMSQGAIDAGLSASQLPALEKIALRISSATGIAAGGTNGIADAMYRLASAYPGLHLATNELGLAAQNAAQLGVLAGQTGNMDSISRMYGAIISQSMFLKHGSSGLTYSNANMQAINQWALAVTGHGDVKMGDLVSAMGTGLLPVAKNVGVSMNQMGAALDILFPAMGASAASTRLKTALGMFAAPSTITGPLYTGTGGSALQVVQAMKKGDLSAGLGVLNKMLHTPLTAASAASYYSAFYGGGLGTFTGGSKGKPTGFIAFLKTHGFTNAQISQAMTGGFASVPGMQDYMILHSFGAGHAGAAMLQLLNAYQSGVFQNKLTGINQAETPQSYRAALKVAYAQPMRQWDIFFNKFKNLTITIGKDVTPAFDGFLHDLESLGHWFGANKWALKALGGMAAGVVGGAALIKLAQGTAGIFHGATSIVRVLTNPGASLKSLFTSGGFGASTTRFGLSVDQFSVAVDAMRGGGLTGLGGTAAKDATTAASDASSVGGVAGVLNYFKTGKVGGVGMGAAALGLGAVFAMSMGKDLAASHGKLTDASIWAGLTSHSSQSQVNAAARNLFATLNGPGSPVNYGSIERFTQQGSKMHLSSQSMAMALLAGHASQQMIEQALPVDASQLSSYASSMHGKIVAGFFQEAATKQHDAAQKSEDAATKNQQAADTLLRAALGLQQLPTMIGAALAPASVYAKTKGARQSAIARK